MGNVASRLISPIVNIPRFNLCIACEPLWQLVWLYLRQFVCDKENDSTVRQTVVIQGKSQIFQNPLAFLPLLLRAQIFIFGFNKKIGIGERLHYITIRCMLKQAEKIFPYDKVTNLPIPTKYLHATKGRCACSSEFW